MPICRSFLLVDHCSVCCILGDKVAEHLAGILIQLLFEAQQGGHEVQPFLAGLRRLSAEWPAVLMPFLPFLGSCITSAGQQHHFGHWLWLSNSWLSNSGLSTSGLSVSGMSV